MNIIKIFKVYLKYIVIVILVILVGWRFWPKDKQVILSPKASRVFTQKPLEKYSFENLRKRVFLGSEVEIVDDVFYYQVDGKKISGQIKMPKIEGMSPSNGYPVVIMIRGYVDQEIYKTGVGTQRAAEVFAKNGFITLAPDFLGFGESDMPPNNVFEERFLRPVQVLQLIASVKNIVGTDPTDINIWGHSNGGQVALSVLEIMARH